MSSISTAPPELYPAPSPHGDLQLAGLRGWVARRPLTGFLIVLGLSWLLLSIPVLAFHGVIPGANLPVEVFALAATLFQSLPQAARTSLRLQTSFRGVSFSSTAATQTMAGQT
jgi:hypothetical protein